MALDTYANLKTSVQDWMARTDLSGNVAEWIALGEARLNRELNPVETDNTLTGTIGSREISTAALSVVEPIALYIVDASGGEAEVTRKDNFAYTSDSGEPSYWRFVQHASAPKIVFDCLLSSADTFRFVARVRFALSDVATTNWLLTNHPDVYLAAALVWGSGFTQKFQEAGAWKTILDEGIPSVRSIIADSKRAVSTVDPALVRIGRRPFYDGTYDQ